MSGWSLHDGLAAGLPVENIDTDQLIPARFMSAPRSEGYGRFLLHDLRGTEGFALDAPEAAGASILVAGRNFGSGSSREAAVYALVDAGFRVVIAPSFGDIFAANAVNNGLLPARADPAALWPVLPARLRVDLEAQTIAAPGLIVSFQIDPVWREKILNGWDDIDLTASHHDRIRTFAAARRAAAPWVWPSRTDQTGTNPTTRENQP
ncbi:MAG: 3-isopropylmalate dehydratase small subunit [Alkalilacustris sp.]